MSDAPRRPRVPLPAGYRQGIISAITVLLGFSLLFLRYWSFEASGEWTRASILADAILVVAIFLELYALWRSLQVEDDDEFEYRRTLRWLLASTYVLFAAVGLAAAISSRLIDF